MTLKPTELVSRAGAICRNVTALAVSAVVRTRSVKEISASLAVRSPGEQALAFGGVALVIFTLSLIAAQFGWLGLLVFWLGLIVVLR